MGTELFFKIAYFFGSIALIYTGFIFIYKNRVVRKNKIYGKKKKYISQLVSQELFFVENKATKKEINKSLKNRSELRDIATDKLGRKILLEILMRLKLDVDGDAETALISLYKELNLHLYAVQRLKSWRWEVVSAAILELTQMQVHETYVQIREFIKDRREVIRVQAEIATISLKEEGIDYFLDSAKYEISDWQQLRIIEALRDKKEFKLPKFMKWLGAANEDVVLLSLRLIKHFEQKNATALFDKLLYSKNERIVEETLGLIKKFKVLKTKPNLEQVFWKLDDGLKISILEIYEEIGNEKDLGFLNQILEREKSDTIQYKTEGILDKIKPQEQPREISEPTMDIIPECPTNKEENLIEGLGLESMGIEMPNEKTQKENSPKALSILSNFNSYDNFNKVLILDACSKIMDENDLPFLKKIVEVEENLPIKIKALELLKLFGDRRLQTRPHFKEYKDLFN